MSGNLAKYTPPRTQGLAVPQRLVELIGEAAMRPLVWIGGPAGCGKTTLVAEYARVSKRRVVWYAFDEDDRDPSRFFEQLSRAVRRRFPRRRLDLPQLTVEYLAAVPSFARSYFRTLYAALPGDFVLVFDNVDAIADVPGVEALLGAAAGELSGDPNLFMVSREQPFESMAALLANGRMAVIGWPQLRLSEDELRAAARRRKVAVEPAELARFDGWIAGLVLATELAALGGDARDRAVSLPLHEVFDYFAGEIYRRMPQATQRYLVANAIWDRIVPALGDRLAEQEQASRILPDLARRNFFTTAHLARGETTYVLHPLFREFLRGQGDASFGPDAWRDLHEKAAAMLEVAGDTEAAIDVRVRVADWAGVSRLCAAVGPELLRGGRHPRMKNWLERIPPAIVNEDATLSLWLGLVDVITQPATGIARLQAAREAYARQGNVPGHFQALVAILESRVMAHEFAGIGTDLAELLALQDEQGGPAAPSLRGIAVPGVLGTMALCFPGHPRLDEWLGQACTLLTTETSRHRRVMVAAEILFAHTIRGETPAARALIAARGADLEETARIPFARIMWEMLRAQFEFFYGDDSNWIDRAVSDCWSESRERGLHTLDHLIATATNLAAFAAGDVAAGAAAAARLRDVAPPRGGYHTARFHLETAWFEWLRGQPLAARAALDTALALPQESATSLLHMYALLGIARIDIDGDDAASALRALARARRTAHREGCTPIVVMAGLLGAELALRRGREAHARRVLEGVLGLAARLSLRRTLFFSAAGLARVLACALRHDIEPAYARQTIRVLGLAPPHAQVDPLAWPYEVTVRTLGGFEILRDGQPLQFGRKAPRRSLQLLKAIIAFGGSRVSQHRLVEALWGDYDADADADAAQRAYRTALYRLRKLLGETNLVTEEQTVSLDPRRCWVDALVFDEATRRLPTLDEPFAPDVLIALYQGHFLEADSAEPWLLSTRERLRSRVLRLVNGHGAHLEDTGAADRALAVYRRGIELDPLAESFYQGAMRAAVAMQQFGEAAGFYRACERVLATAFGLQPSPPTREIYAALSRRH